MLQKEISQQIPLRDGAGFTCSPSEDVAAGRGLEQPQGPRLEQKAERAEEEEYWTFPFSVAGM